MPFILRKIRKSKWYKNEGVPWLEKNDLQADALNDLQTKGNNLSVWHIEDDKSNLERVITALAANSDNISNFDYVLLEINKLSKLGIKIIENSEGAKTPDNEANRLWHCHITELSLKKLLKLINTINDVKKERITESQIARLISESIIRGQISRSELSPNVLKNISI